MVRKNQGSINVALSRQTVKFLGFERRLLESNIWDIFPRLDKVVCEGHLSYCNKSLGSLGSKDDEIFHFSRRDWELSKM